MPVGVPIVKVLYFYCAKSADESVADLIKNFRQRLVWQEKGGTNDIVLLIEETPLSMDEKMFLVQSLALTREETIFAIEQLLSRLEQGNLP